MMLEASVLVASILKVKSNYLNEDYVKTSELNFIRREMQKYLIDNDIDVTIIDGLDDIYYYVQDGIILCNKKNAVTKDDVYEHFSQYINYKLEKIIFNEDLIYDLLIKLKMQELDKIVEKNKSYVKKIG